MITTRLIKGNDTLIVMFEDESFTFEEGFEPSILLVKDIDWNRDLSPWPAERVFKKGEDFAGCADQTLAVILEAMNSVSYRKAIIAGYSLAGLFALYACTVSSRFDACVSASGSLWYEGFDTWLKEHPVQCDYVFLSLGDNEKNTRNPRMAKVEEKTREAYELISGYTACELQMNPGGHFNDPEGRLRRAIRQTLNKINK